MKKSIFIILSLIGFNTQAQVRFGVFDYTSFYSSRIVELGSSIKSSEGVEMELLSKRPFPHYAFTGNLIQAKFISCPENPARVGEIVMMDWDQQKLKIEDFGFIKAGIKEGRKYAILNMDEYAKVAANVGDYDNYKQIWNGYADVYIDPTSLNEYLPDWIFVAAKVTSLPDKEWECGYMKTSDLNLEGITLTPSQNTYPVYTNDQRIQVSLMNSPANNVDLNDVKWMEMLGTATSIGVLKLDFYKQVTAACTIMSKDLYMASDGSVYVKLDISTQQDLDGKSIAYVDITEVENYEFYFDLGNLQVKENLQQPK
ncbi:MAG: hypothetical protein IT221_12160 [Fluviicola sp.]|nr:hypothetical protein [Fluviicola sp.]